MDRATVILGIIGVFLSAITPPPPALNSRIFLHFNFF